MRKNQLTFIFILTLFLCQLSLLPTVDDGKVLAHFTSPDSTNSVGEGASVKSEEENIDSFDVFPSTRWDVAETGWGSKTVLNSLLNLTDIGDGSSDSYRIRRGLNKLDSKIELRFKYLVNASCNNINDRFLFTLESGEGAETTGIYFEHRRFENTRVTLLAYDDIEGGVQQITFDEDEELANDTWYTIKFTYNILKSIFRCRGSFDNGSRVFDYVWQDAGTVFPIIFSKNSIEILLDTKIRTIDAKIQMFYDWIKAPFKEKEWTQSSIPTDPEIIVDSLLGFSAEDDVNDGSAYQITIPFLDAISGVFKCNFTNPANLIDGDGGNMGIIVYNVDSDDGDLHAILDISLGLGNTNPFGNDMIYSIDLGPTTIANVFREGDFNPRMSFSFRTKNDRSLGELRLRLWEDIYDTTDPVFIDYVGNVTISQVSDDPSQEFVIKIFYQADFDGDVEFQALWEDFGFIERDIFTDFINAIVEPLGNFLQQIFVGIFRFLADIFKFVGDLITDSISTMQTAITVAIGTITSALATLQTAVEGITTAIGLLAADIASEVWDGIGSALDFVTDAIAEIAVDIWDAFGTAAADIMDDIITALTSLASDVADFLDGVIQFLIPLLIALASDFADWLVSIGEAIIAIGGDILEGIMNFMAGIVFFIWESLGLPDILAVIEPFVSVFFDIISNLPAFFTDFTTLLTTFTYIIIGFYWLWVIFLGFAQHGFDIFAGLGESVNRLFTIYNFNTSIGTIPIPIAIIFIPMTYFLVIPSGSVFAIW